MKVYSLKTSTGAVLPVYSLSELMNNDTYQSYYVNAKTGFIFSSKKCFVGTMRPLRLSSQNGKSGYSLSWRNRKFFISVDEIKTSIRKCVPEEIAKSDSDKAAGEEWVILRDDLRTIFSKVYATETAARIDAEEYAKANMGQRYSVCRIVGTVVADSVRWI